MKKNIIYMAALAVLTAACSNEDDNILPGSETGSTDEVRMITETITATNGDAAGSASTRAAVGADAKFTWSAGDQVAVHVSDGKYYTTTALAEGGSNSAEFSVSYPEGASRDAFAVFPSSIVILNAANYGQSGASLDVTLPKEYDVTEVKDHITPCPMIADNTGSSWTFKQLCGLLRLTITNIPSGTDYLKLDFNGRKVSGDFSIASPVTPGTSTIQSVAGTKGTDDYIMITGLGDVTSYTVNIPLPTGTAYSDLTVSAWNSSNVPLKAQVTPFSYTASRAKGKKVTSALSLGVFSIAYGKYAVFSPGNLQYKASSNEWRFAEHQYDYIGSDNASVSSSYTGWIDLFGWGTSGKSFDSGYGSAYQPWSKSTTSSSAYGPTGTNNLTGTYANGDWGVNMGSGWRTLTGNTSGEWNYLLKTRKVNGGTGSGHSYTLGKWVNNVLGVVLYPDDYTGAAYTNSANWSTFESAGCVFLPAAGWRSGSSVNSVGSYGAYWSSTAYGTDYAYYVFFYSDSVNPTSYNGRSSGYSVRLVRPVE